MNDQLSRAERLQAQANEANAAQWAAWSDRVNAWIEDFKGFRLMLLGEPGAGFDPDTPLDDLPLLVGLSAQFASDERKERSEALARLSSALDERISAEVGVLSETLSTKLDSKIFDLGELKKFRTDIEQAGRALRAHVSDQVGALDGRFAEIERRVDAVDARRRADRQATKEAAKTDLMKAAALVGAMSNKINARLDEQDGRLAAIEEALHEAYRDPHSPLRLGST